MNPFRPVKNFFSKINQGMSVTAKAIIAVLLMVILTGSGVVAYKFYDFTQNNPKFCVSCHIMKPAFEAWEKSEHTGINCHECHHLTIPEQNRLLISFVLHRPTSVPERHGKVIVPWKYCIRCHWEKDEKFPKAPMINQSTLHAKHVFMEQVECSKCHGYVVHKFTPEEHFCTRCHKGKEVHGTGMEALACLNCHTDRTTDLRPGRKKCLFCHGGEEVRRELIADGTIDVKHYQPTKETIGKALKISVPADAPMQFYCYTCHKPHAKVRPDWGDCLSCHRNIIDVGKHNLHIKVVGMQCKECHKPHVWRVTPESGKRACIRCHEYRDPKRFIG
ncbi:MAG TPA: NapC/NirT family cytochrome c [Thermodesulfovibrionales bacterium]|nr:NapC/NirT family cytochrome c [Thermodesulfovibrionales bacterium]